MPKNTILKQMGIEQWRLREPLLKKIDDKAFSETEALSESSQQQSSVSITEAETKQSVISQAQDTQLKPQQHDWSSLIDHLNNKSICPSCADVTPILGDGDANADWMFVFDSPTTRDIEQQKLITGRAGQLFDAILLALNLDRDAVYLSSIFKCPPAQNITENSAQCDTLLEHQLKLIQPKVVIAFGEFTTQALIKANEGLDQLRMQEVSHSIQPVRVIPTYSLMQILDTPLLKAKVWDDLKKARQLVVS